MSPPLACGCDDSSGIQIPQPPLFRSTITCIRTCRFVGLAYRKKGTRKTRLAARNQSVAGGESSWVACLTLRPPSVRCLAGKPDESVRQAKKSAFHQDGTLRKPEGSNLSRGSRPVGSFHSSVVRLKGRAEGSPCEQLRHGPARRSSRHTGHTIDAASGCPSTYSSL